MKRNNIEFHEENKRIYAAVYAILEENNLIDILFKRKLSNILDKLDKYAQKYSFDNSDYFENTSWSSLCKGFRREWLDGHGNNTYGIFNGEKFRIPDDYDSILRSIYGDYMKLPPKEEQVGHHFYTVYRK